MPVKYLFGELLGGILRRDCELNLPPPQIDFEVADCDLKHARRGDTPAYVRRQLEMPNWHLKTCLSKSSGGWHRADRECR